MSNQKSADHVDRGEANGEEGQRVAPQPAPAQYRADQRDAADGVRTAHQRRMQRGRHFGNDLKTDEHGEDEDG